MQNRRINDKKFQLVSSTSYDWKNVAMRIIDGKVTPYDRAKTIYEWLIDNISRDIYNIVDTADNCWDEERGTSRGFSELFYRLGTAVGLDIRIIVGIDKMGNEHCWNVISKSYCVAEEIPFPEFYEFFDVDFHRTRALNDNITRRVPL